MTTPVLVVGAGPVGLVAAARLTRLGVPTRLVDELPVPSPFSKAVVVHARTLEMLEAMGIAGPFIDAGVRITAAEVRSGGKVLVRSALDDVASRYPFMLDLPQDSSEAILAQHLVDVGGRVERGVRLAGLAAGDDEVDVTLEHADGRTEHTTVGWVIGCDGGHSTVRDAVGTKLKGSFHGVTFLLADVEVDWELDHETTTMFLHPAGVSAVFPLPGTRARMYIQLEDEQPHGSEPTLEQLQAAVVERIDAGAVVRDPHWLTYFEVHHGQVPAYRFGRVFLAGDAAHIHSPAGGQGMNTGMQDAYNLAWKLALVCHGRAAPQLLDSYGAERHPVGARVVKGTSLLTEVGTAANPALRLVRDGLMTVVGRVPAATKRMASTVTEATIGYPESAIVDEAVRHRPGHQGHDDRIEAGEHAPDVEGLGHADGATVRLAEVLDDARHTALLIVSQGDGGPAARGRLVRRLKQDQGELLKCGLVLRQAEVTGPGVGRRCRRPQRCRRRILRRQSGHARGRTARRLRRLRSHSA